MKGEGIMAAGCDTATVEICGLTQLERGPLTE